MCHIIYFLKSCWNQAITLKDALENIPKPLGEKPEWLAPRGYNGLFENNGRVVKLACESQLALWNHTWILHPIHLASLQRAMAIWAAIFFLRLHGEKVSQWSRSKILSPLGWPINLGILKSAYYWAITCSAGLWNFDWIFFLSQGDAQKGEPGERGPGVCTWLKCLPKKVIPGC